MEAWIASQLILSAIGVLFVVGLRLRYHLVVSRPVMRQAEQYRLDAIRDREFRHLINVEEQET